MTGRRAGALSQAVITGGGIYAHAADPMRRVQIDGNLVLDDTSGNATSN